MSTTLNTKDLWLAFALSIIGTQNGYPNVDEAIAYITAGVPFVGTPEIFEFHDEVATNEVISYELEEGTQITLFDRGGFL